ncbi:LysM peptidoglycan-binding domain-containing protein [Liquorilactobacillus satsumensis]|uniref:Peptidoglycan binding protein n=1 Tax=Liquorilactobacillus satsumensis DSM 16230 = JCM 12392 TaxID=1423801 RepID=A0A0R1UYR7_9LACO|nr:LysM domain-containing protein [Liquorilactobacillus satsumensis]KRL97908.1 peptidoglycan binding protein [Liquorilactobacillus satsumensis DSM 16230 = JCM 12392]
MNIKKILLSAATVAGVLTAGTLAANADSVTVQSGQTVSELAHQYNTSVAQIKQSNNLSNENLIYVGQKLEIGASTTASTTTTSTSNTASSTTAASTQTSTQAQAPVAQKQQTSTTTSNTAAASSNTNNNAAAASTSNNTASTQQAATTSSTTNTTVSTSSDSDASAKAWIANQESGGSYTVRNGQYVGKYQLSASYLNGDYSAANQEAVAESYVTSRYGSWSAAKQHWLSNGWY